MSYAVIDVKNISVVYEKGREAVIKGVDICVEQGNLIALLGRNGSGKTTLLKAICGLLPSKSDQFMICGENAKRMTVKQKASCISYVPQKHGIIYPIAALEVALMGINPYLKWYETPSKEHRKLAEAMIAYMGISQLADEDFLSLSEGQKQLVILARALVQNAPVMLFDEPDSALDFQNRKEILQKIRQVVKEKNCGGLLTLHDPDYALRYCDKILILQNGVIHSTILCRDTSREEAEEKLRLLYPALKLISCGEIFLTIK